MTQTLPRPTTALLTYAAIADAVLVVLFALSGRSSHHESLDPAGILWTAWPFLAALAVAWLVTRAWKQPVRLWPHGVCIWLITVSGGMALRILTGETAAAAFVAVATIVLGIFLLGHRLLASLVLRRVAGR